jgi:hypothetical protein
MKRHGSSSQEVGTCRHRGAAEIGVGAVCRALILCSDDGLDL